MDVRRAIRTTQPGRHYIVAFWATQIVIVAAAVAISGSRFWVPWLVGYCVFALAREAITLRGCAELERAHANLAGQNYLTYGRLGSMGFLRRPLTGTVRSADADRRTTGDARSMSADVFDLFDNGTAADEFGGRAVAAWEKERASFESQHARTVLAEPGQSVVPTASDSMNLTL